MHLSFAKNKALTCISRSQPSEPVLKLDCEQHMEQNPMTSAKQIAANRQNAQKSTGPRTSEGKALINMNALRHGLTGQVNLMPDEDREAHDKFCAALVESLAPEGALEIQFAQSIAEDNWRMNRGRAVETNMFALGAFYPAGPEMDTSHAQINAAISAAQTFAADPKKFQLLSLYMQRTNRDMLKSMDRLADLQTERKARRQQALEEAAALVQYSKIKHLPIESMLEKGQALSSQESGQRQEIVVSGFVFSIHQIHAFVTRKRQLKDAVAAQNRQNNHHNGKHNDRKHQFSRAA